MKHQDPESNDGKFYSLCDSGRIRVGLKLHMVNQSLVSCSGSEDEETEHYFLRHRQKYQLKLNVNGISLAREKTKLGAQRSFLVPKSLSAIAKNALGTTISLVDCIIVKKYPLTYSEFRLANKGKGNDKAKVTTRMVQTVEYLQSKFNQQEFSYRPNFKLKVVDALKTHVCAVVSVQNQCQETHDSLSVGDRISLVNLQVGGWGQTASLLHL